jgi:hypothetical protein
MRQRNWFAFDLGLALLEASLRERLAKHKARIRAAREEAHSRKPDHLRPGV